MRVEGGVEVRIACFGMPARMAGMLSVLIAGLRCLGLELSGAPLSCLGVCGADTFTTGRRGEASAASCRIRCLIQCTSDSEEGGKKGVKMTNTLPSLALHVGGKAYLFQYTIGREGMVESLFNRCRKRWVESHLNRGKPCEMPDSFDKSTPSPCTRWFQTKRVRGR